MHWDVRKTKTFWFALTLCLCKCCCSGARVSLRVEMWISAFNHLDQFNHYAFFQQWLHLQLFDVFISIILLIQCAIHIKFVTHKVFPPNRKLQVKDFIFSFFQIKMAFKTNVTEIQFISLRSWKMKASLTCKSKGNSHASIIFWGVFD